ncbi:aminotransferase class I/II-fold pyridoxal phosphate-dependent enzyme [Simkania negevensis]|uniref:Aminotransferase class I/II-fold pyridoxal phosphate-dependent enzyme n=1 Tax=Simkania negevensis TaxID=83561 RepID=A0ABS3ASN9_9BACT|nr:aminotransferase class I/II-fold pyridoxal phosphate-dependent enzyme [Simkania negevensis]
MVLFADRIHRIGTENAFKIGPHIVAAEGESSRLVVRLNIGEPDFNIPEWVKDEVKEQIDANNTHYTDPKGVLSLREVVSQQMNETRGLQSTPEEVVVFPGLKPAIGFAQEVYCNPGDEVIYPSPGYPIYESFTRYLELEPRPLILRESNAFSFCAKELEDIITDKTRLIYINFPSNPTGGVTTQEQLREIADLIVNKCHPDVRVFSDEMYEHIVFDGASHLSIASMPGMRERTIVASGLSKTYAWTGGRIGYAVFPTVEEADVFKNMNINYFSCTSPYNQEGARVALTHPNAAGRIAEMVSTFKKRRDYLVKRLNTIDGITCTNPSGTFYLFPNIEGACKKLGVFDAFDALDEAIKEKTSPATMVQMFLLYRHQVAVLDRRSFGVIDSEGQHYLRLSYAANDDDLKEGADRIEQACQDTKSFQTFVNTHLHLFQ